MEKLTKEERKELLLAYKLDNSKENIKRLVEDYGISKRRIFQIVEEEREKGNNSIIPLESNFTKRANEIIDLTFSKIEERLKDSEDKSTIAQLATLLGIMYDKSRLEQNLSTNNSSININIKVEK